MKGLGKMTSLDAIVKRTGGWQYLVRFLSVGMVGTLVDLTLYTALHVMLGAPTLAANTVSYSAGIVNNYLLHRYWTYADRIAKGAGAQFSQFTLVSASALVLNNLLVLVLAHPLGILLAQPGAGDLLAKLCATGVGVCWNFVINNYWTFSAAPKRTEE
jgi:putative flippase GtrA